VAVGVGISLGFACVLIAMLGWHLLSYRRRRRQQTKTASTFSLGRDEHVKPGTGSSSRSGSEDVAGKPEMIESTTKLEWPKDREPPPRSAVSSVPPSPQPPSPQPPSPMIEDPLLPKAERRGRRSRPEMMEQSRGRKEERDLTRDASK